MKKFVLIILVVVIGASTNAQTNNTGNIELYHCMGELPPQQKQLMIQYNFKAAPLIDGRYIDPTGSDVFDSVSFRQGIEKHFPGVADTGIGIIDWETKTFDSLCYQPANSKAFKRSISRFTEILDIAKRLRPNVRWGIYNVPYYSYWKRADQTWKNQGEILKPLLAKTDILMISLYDFYKDGTQYTDDKAFVQENMRMALQVAQELGKPLFVFIWQRYHNSNPDNGLELIPQQEFVLHIDNILQTTFKDQHVAGLIWFDAQDYFYKTKPAIINADLKSLRTTEEKLRDLSIKTYASLIKKSVDAAMKK